MKVRMMMTRWSVLVTAMFGALGVLGALAASGGLYAFAAVGYSRLSMPGDDAAGNGVLVAGGVGGRFMLSPELDGFVEAGYLWATHRVSQEGNDPRLDVDYFLLAAGLALDL